VKDGESGDDDRDDLTSQWTGLFLTNHFLLLDKPDETTTKW